LRRTLPSPLAPRDDRESSKGSDKDKANESERKDKEKDKDQDKDKDNDKDKSKDKDKEKEKDKGKDSESKETEAAGKKEDGKPDAKKDEKPKPVEIDLGDFERRAVLLPPKPGRYGNLAAVTGKLLYRRLARTGSADEKDPIVLYDLEKREEKTVVDDAGAFALCANREKLLVSKGTNYHLIEPKEGQKLDKPLAIGGFEARIDPAAEWKQIFTDAWRLERDLFYDPGLHGVDWKEMRERYGKLLEHAVTRWDVNYVLGELIAELNASHTYRGGGDLERDPQRGVGYLGCDFSFENGAFRIKKIIEAAPWDLEVRSPLRQPGMTNVHEGDFLLAVNGEPLDPNLEPYAAFQGLADKPVLLTLNERPSREGAREVLVQTLGSEARLRHLAWINANRERVSKATDGRWVTSTCPTRDAADRTNWSANSTRNLPNPD